MNTISTLFVESYRRNILNVMVSEIITRTAIIPRFYIFNKKIKLFMGAIKHKLLFLILDRNIIEDQQKHSNTIHDLNYIRDVLDRGDLRKISRDYHNGKWKFPTTLS